MSPYVALLLGLVLAAQAGAQDEIPPFRVIGPIEPVVFEGDVRDRSVPPGPPPEPGPGALPPPSFAPPMLTFPGNPFTPVVPPDPGGAPGTDQYIHVVKSSLGTLFTVYDKLGRPLTRPTTLHELAQDTTICEDGSGNALVLWDRDAGRWIVSEVALFGFAGIPIHHLCIYVSRTSDPVLGGWFVYQFLVREQPQFPSLAVWPDAYLVGTAEPPVPAAYALDRAAALAGEPATLIKIQAPSLAGFQFQALAPADRDGPTPPPPGSPGLFLRHVDDELHEAPGDAASDFVEVFELRSDFETPERTTLTGPFRVAVEDFDSTLCEANTFECVPQPGTDRLLDPLAEFLGGRVQYRNFGVHESLLTSFSVDVDGGDRAGIRWLELRRSGAEPWSLFQEGTWAPDDAHRWVSSAAMDGAGNVALGYSVSSSSVFPSLRYTGRLAEDPLGQMTVPEETLAAGGGSQTSINRWGNHSAMYLDPTDDCTFWFTGEFQEVTEATRWSTRVGVFAFPSCANAAPVAVPLAATPAECTSPAGARVTLDGSASTDSDSSPGTNDDIASFEWLLEPNSPDETRLGFGEVLEADLPLGASRLGLRVIDTGGASDTAFFGVDVVDTTPPMLQVALDPAVLFPPNHRLVPVRATVAASDRCGPASVLLESVASDQPARGRFEPDVRGAVPDTPDVAFELRAERQGGARTYRAVYRALDAAGNVARAEADARVPHDRRRR